VLVARAWFGEEKKESAMKKAVTQIVFCGRLWSWTKQGSTKDVSALSM
jgi:hypothetical protein